VMGGKFARDGERRNDVASGAAAGDEYAQVRQISCSLRSELIDGCFPLGLKLRT
jgi:hypothetical protein